jgi:DNA-binding transcriptional ArsR family regulator
MTVAARELSLTQFAVSRQIKTLENRLGVELFIRERRTIRLSAADDSYARQICEALRKISAASTNFAPIQGSARSISPYFPHSARAGLRFVRRDLSPEILASQSILQRVCLTSIFEPDRWTPRFTLANPTGPDRRWFYCAPERLSLHAAQISTGSLVLTFRAISAKRRCLASRPGLTPGIAGFQPTTGL